jgi:hypothetical protein
MISAMVTSSTGPTALVTSSRVTRFMFFVPLANLTCPPAVAAGGGTLYLSGSR